MSDTVLNAVIVEDFLREPSPIIVIKRKDGTQLRKLKSNINRNSSDIQKLIRVPQVNSLSYAEVTSPLGVSAVGAPESKSSTSRGHVRKKITHNNILTSHLVCGSKIKLNESSESHISTSSQKACIDIEKDYGPEVVRPKMVSHISKNCVASKKTKNNSKSKMVKNPFFYLFKANTSSENLKNKFSHHVSSKHTTIDGNVRSPEIINVGHHGTTSKQPKVSNMKDAFKKNTQRCNKKLCSAVKSMASGPQSHWFSSGDMTIPDLHHKSLGEKPITLPGAQQEKIRKSINTEINKNLMENRVNEEGHNKTKQQHINIISEKYLSWLTELEADEFTQEMGSAEPLGSNVSSDEEEELRCNSSTICSHHMPTNVNFPCLSSLEKQPNMADAIDTYQNLNVQVTNERKSINCQDRMLQPERDVNELDYQCDDPEIHVPTQKETSTLVCEGNASQMSDLSRAKSPVSDVPIGSPCTQSSVQAPVSEFNEALSTIIVGGDGVAAMQDSESRLAESLENEQDNETVDKFSTTQHNQHQQMVRDVQTALTTHQTNSATNGSSHESLVHNVALTVSSIGLTDDEKLDKNSNVYNPSQQCISIDAQKTEHLSSQNDDVQSIEVNDIPKDICSDITTQQSAKVVAMESEFLKEIANEISTSVSGYLSDVSTICRYSPLPGDGHYSPVLQHVKEEVSPHSVCQDSSLDDEDFFDSSSQDSHNSRVFQQHIKEEPPSPHNVNQKLSDDQDIFDSPSWLTEDLNSESPNRKSRTKCLTNKDICNVILDSDNNLSQESDCIMSSGPSDLTPETNDEGLMIDDDDSRTNVDVPESDVEESETNVRAPGTIQEEPLTDVEQLDSDSEESLSDVEEPGYAETEEEAVESSEKEPVITQEEPQTDVEEPETTDEEIEINEEVRDLASNRTESSPEATIAETDSEEEPSRSPADSSMRSKTSKSAPARTVATSTASSSRKPRGSLYTQQEKKNIVAYIIEQKGYTHLKGKTFWNDMETAEICPGRTWQSLKEHFIKHVMPYIHRYVDPATAHTFHQGVRCSKRSKEMLGHASNFYTDKENKILVQNLLKCRRYKMVGGVNVWKRLENQNVLPGRSWQSMRDHYRKVLVNNLRGMSLSQAEAQALRSYCP